jgi:hypothetical protein
MNSPLRALVVFALAASSNAAESDIAQADSLYKARFVPGNLDRSISILTSAAPGSKDYATLWRLARCFFCKGEKASAKGKVPLFEQGKRFAQQAIEANARGVEGHYWYAALIGSIGQENGMVSSLFLIKPIQQEIDTCIAIDSTYAPAHDMMAHFLYRVPGPPLSIGNKKRAQHEALLSTRYDSTAIGYWFNLGRIAAENKDYATARQALRKAASLPDNGENPFLSAREKEEARKLLNKIAAK